MIMKLKGILMLALAAMTAASCGTDSATQAPETTSQEAAAPEAVTPNGDTAIVELQSDDNMRYDKNEIRVKEGDLVKLTLRHTGKMPRNAMGHNFVLLRQGVDVDAFGGAAGQAKAPDYALPSELLQDVIVMTPMIGGGESAEIEFLTPAKGTYTFLCSFPGHYGLMKGSFIVE
jgi:azurin